MPGTVYRSRSRNPLRERLVDVGIGTITGMAVALVLAAITLSWVFG
jgi:FlaG/FlaF family flagellin (archaellin)